MNYIDEDTAFERWCENNYLPILAQAIWKKLFKRFNRSGWREWITVDNLTLMADVQIEHVNTFSRNRDKLIESGLIQYIKGKKGSPNKYKLISFEIYSAINELKTELQTELKTELKTEVQTADIPKLNKTKLNIKKENRAKEKTFVADATALKKFVQPSVEEVKEYCSERKNNINPENFIDFYISKGWKIGKEAMKDWKAAVRTWEQRNKTAVPLEYGSKSEWDGVIK